MPRKSRIDTPGALHHIIARGIEKKAIFKDTQDRNNFLDRLGKVLAETSTACYAWVLMPNHVHLLLRAGLAPISNVMQRLLTGYAQQFNRRHKRHGRLFQNRYKSFLCEEDPYLLELVCYIHLNSLRAHIVKDMKALNFYPYSGHAVIMGKLKYECQDSDYVLRLFGKRVGAARRSYFKFVSQKKSQGRRPDLVGGGLIRSAAGWSALITEKSAALRIMGDERILGSNDFVESVLQRANEDYEQRTRILAKGQDLNTLIECIADYFEIDTESLYTATKQPVISRARALLCYFAVNNLMMRGAEVAHRLGVSPSSVSRSVARGRADNLVEKIQKICFEV
jgi:REP element-mobilizing transposase RayT